MRFVHEKERDRKMKIKRQSRSVPLVVRIRTDDQMREGLRRDERVGLMERDQ